MVAGVAPLLEAWSSEIRTLFSRLDGPVVIPHGHDVYGAIVSAALGLPAPTSHARRSRARRRVRINSKQAVAKQDAGGGSQDPWPAIRLPTIHDLSSLAEWAGAGGFDTCAVGGCARWRSWTSLVDEVQACLRCAGKPSISSTGGVAHSVNDVVSNVGWPRHLQPSSSPAALGAPACIAMPSSHSVDNIFGAFPAKAWSHSARMPPGTQPPPECEASLFCSDDSAGSAVAAEEEEEYVKLSSDDEDGGDGWDFLVDNDEVMASLDSLDESFESDMAGTPTEEKIFCDDREEAGQEDLASSTSSIATDFFVGDSVECSEIEADDGFVVVNRIDLQGEATDPDVLSLGRWHLEDPL